VVGSLACLGDGPVGLVHTQNFQFFQNRKPTSVAESYKTDLGHKAGTTVVLMPVVDGKSRKHLLTLSYSAFWTLLGHQRPPKIFPSIQPRGLQSVQIGRYNCRILIVGVDMQRR
jgi:hypothetical protein